MSFEETFFGPGNKLRWEQIRGWPSDGNAFRRLAPFLETIRDSAPLTLLPRVVSCLQERGLEDVLIFAGGIIPDEDVTSLKDAGVAAVFGPGTNTDHVVEFIRGQFQTA